MNHWINVFFVGDYLKHNGEELRSEGPVMNLCFGPKNTAEKTLSVHMSVINTNTYWLWITEAV